MKCDKVQTLNSASDVQSVKNHILEISRQYVDIVVENNKKFKDKQVEINFLKSLGPEDTKDEKYK